AAQEIAQVSPKTRAILLTMYSEEPYVAKALQVGITGYVLKTQSSADLLQAIRDVMAGGIYLSPGISQAIVNAYLSRHELSSHPLTVREREVLRLVAEGKTTREVGQALGISTETAESHRMRIMANLDIHETDGFVRDQAAVLASAQRLQPDLLLLDLHLPPIGGIEAARALLARRAMPLVLIADYGVEDQVRRAGEAGVLAHLVWPSDLSALEVAI